MKDFLRKYSQFMIGRYGVDDLFYFLMAFLIITGFFPFRIFGKALFVIRLLVFGYALYRYFSKNFSARQKENTIYLKYFGPLKKEAKYQFTRIANIKKYRYRRCPECHQQLRLPIVKGKHTVKCPKCNHEFETHIYF